MIHELQAEKLRLDAAIEALERLSAGKARRRGRPPKWLKNEILRNTEELAGHGHRQRAVGESAED